MAIDPQVFVDRLVSHASTLGVFSQINLNEYRNAPVGGIACAIWHQRSYPQPGASGLAATTMRMVYNVRTRHVISEVDMDLIDPAMVRAVTRLMEEYSGDFDLGETVQCIDLLGRGGQEPLSYEAGYMEQDRSHTYRVFTINVPLIVNDAFEQAN